MEKKLLLAIKPSAVYIDTVVTVCKMMTYDDFVNMVKDMPHVNVNCNQEIDGDIGYCVRTYRNGVEVEPMKWTTSPTGATVGRKCGLAFSEALTASQLGMFVARKAWDKHDVAMRPIDPEWPIEVKGLPPLWARTKNKCTMPLNLNVPDFIANDWYIMIELPSSDRYPGHDVKLHGGFPRGQMAMWMENVVVKRTEIKTVQDPLSAEVMIHAPGKTQQGAMMDHAASKERPAKKLIDHFAEDFPSWRPREYSGLSDGNPSSQMHDKITANILKHEHKLAQNQRQAYPQERYSVNMFAAEDLNTNVAKEQHETRPHQLIPLASQLGYPGKDATDNLTLDQRLNERARIQRESGM